MPTSSDAPARERQPDADGSANEAPSSSAGDSGSVVNSEALLGGRSQLAIRHRQTVYFLRQTRFGKLILTK